MDRTEKVGMSVLEKKAKTFRICKWISLASLIFFLLFGLIFFKNDLTVENLKYLIKYLDFSGYGSYSEETVIHYNADNANRFFVFRGDLALINPKGLTLYDRKGDVVLNDSYNMSHPVAISSDRYMIVYDLGGKEIRIYNSFALLYEKRFDYLIQSVGTNSDGDFCVVTSEKSYHSAVYVFDDDLNQIHQWRSASSFAVDAALSNELLSVSTVHVQDGILVSQLLEMQIGSDEEPTVYPLGEEMPLAQHTMEEGTFLLTDGAFRYLVEGEELTRTDLSTGSVDQVAFGENLTAVLQDELLVGVNFRLRIFDREGREVATRRFSVSVRDVEIYKNTVYVLTHSGLVVLQVGETSTEVKEYALAGDYSQIGVLSEGIVVLCSDTAANIRILEQGG